MQKIKQFIESPTGKDVLTVVIVILVGISSFCLGRLSKAVNSNLKVEYVGEALELVPTGQGASVISASSGNGNNGTSTSTSQDSFFASSRGTKYYSTGCTAGNNIKQENRIYFTTREEAERAGYSMSTSCR